MSSKTGVISERFMQVMGFNDADLKANRVGRLSDRQKRDIWKQQSDSAFKWWLIIGVTAIPVVFGLTNRIWGIFLLPYFLGPLILEVIAAFIEQSKIRRLMSNGRVTMIEGVLYKRIVQQSLGKNGKTLYQVVIDNTRFSVTEDVFDALHDDMFYRLYYVATTAFLKGKVLKLLAAEWLDDEEALARLNDSREDYREDVEESARSRYAGR